MKKAIMPIGVFLCIILFVYIIPWLIISDGCSIISGRAKPGKPAITYGEFPFEVTYRIGNKTVTEKGTYVCEFQGVKYNIGQGYYYDWKGYIKETGKKAIYITEDDERIVYCSVGAAEYYIFNSEFYGASPYKPRFYDNLKNPNGDNYTPAELSEHFDLEIIEYKLSDPIQ